MLLAIDVGNTDITAALFNGEVIEASFRLTTQQGRTSDEFGMVFSELIERSGFSIDLVQASVIASAVPDAMHAIINALIKYFGVKPMVVGPGTKTGIRLIKTNPSEVGPGRIADAVAALKKYNGPVIVVNYGTATTYDFFRSDGSFEAAVTSPGILLSLRALWKGTAMLPEIQVKNPGTVMAKNTENSLQAGIVYGTVGESEYIINKIKKECGEDPDSIKVVATGGLAFTIAELTDSIQFVDPNLTMHGLRLIYEKNR